ncbi:MAG: pantoate--beta-alanine ligase [Chloroflexi bacterium]|nr:pantoate--beta-alanine ligase [Chloroflexota bacterium]
MKVLESVAAMRVARQAMAGSMGFVPTMGYLHEGHMALARRARAENEHVVASIFVNPTQFGPHEDFERYPRNQERDLAMLQKEGVDAVFLPPVVEMYPSGSCTYVTVEGLSQKLEGASRPGHFRGVATVVAKLFNIVQPARAYFGQKDAQQVVIIKKMAADLDMNLEIVVCPTVREPDGLAMSSRNVYLNPAERRAALVLWQALCLAREMWQKGERRAEVIPKAMRELIQKEPLARLDYVSLAHSQTLEELESIPKEGEGSVLASLAVYIGKTRLIDNIVLE